MDLHSFEQFVGSAPMVSGWALPPELAAGGTARIETRLAATAAELDAVQRSRYDIYVEELHRYGARADHDRRKLAEPEDDWSWVWYAVEGGEIIASARVTWGGHGFSDRQIAQYRLAPFLEEVPHDRLAVGERFMVTLSRRGSPVLEAMAVVGDPFHHRHGVRVMFGACEPHLLSMYCAKRASRPYAQRNINHPDAGYLIPTITFLDGPDALNGCGNDDGPPRCVEAALTTSGTIRSPLLEDPDRYHADLLATIQTMAPTVFDGLTVEEIAGCTARSSIVITCSAGDRILKRGGAARNLYVVLDGALEVRDGPDRVAVLLPGDVFGETAFLLRCPRTFDVDVLEAGTRLLAISERTLRRLATDAPTAGAKFFTNLATVLSARLVAAG